MTVSTPSGDFIPLSRIESLFKELVSPKMKTAPATPTTIDEYIASYPREVQPLLQKVRETIRKAAPGAKEAIKYRLPTFILNGNLVHFGAFKHHIGFYPTASGIAHFKKRLSGYASSRGAVQFPLDKPVPFALISEIVKFRVKETLERAAAKGKRR